MKITYDSEAHAGYVYFTVVGIRGVAETISYQRLAVDLDKENQIVGLRVFESEDFDFSNRLKYLVQHREVEYREADGHVRINFAQNAIVDRTVSWDGNIDFDRNGQIVGLEILFAPPDYEPNDGSEHLCAEGKLAHLSKYLVPFDDVY